MTISKVFANVLRPCRGQASTDVIETACVASFSTGYEHVPLPAGLEPAVARLQDRDRGAPQKTSVWSGHETAAFPATGVEVVTVVGKNGDVVPARSATPLVEPVLLTPPGDIETAEAMMTPPVPRVAPPAGIVSKVAPARRSASLSRSLSGMKTSVSGSQHRKATTSGASTGGPDAASQPGTPAAAEEGGSRKQELLTYCVPARTSNTRPGSRADVFDSAKVVLTIRDEPVTTLAMEMLAGVAEELGVSTEKLRRFLRAVETSMPPNHYHNTMHVLDVTQLMYIQTLEGGPIADICADPVVKLSALLAAICHDYNHPGFSTAFLISSGHQLVKRYGKESTLEKMHLHCLRELCADPDTCFLTGLDSTVQERVLNYAEHIIMATDMSQHMAYIHAEPPEDPEELIIFKLKLAMKCADLSHCVRKFSIHYAFVEKLKAEFYNQGDKERELQLPISPGMDRGEDYRQMAFSQAYFLSNFILPLYTAWSKHTNGNAMVEKLRAVLQRNITSWKLLCAEPDTTGYDVSNACSGSIPVRKLVRDASKKDVASKSWSNMIVHEQVQAMYGVL